ncbi:MAG: hypothetical protein Q8K79_22025, partial [Solirubrobacteraceae bacterium]|nr:hypothetical protein [Solirubrobacteraceae bacterium]
MRFEQHRQVQPARARSSNCTSARGDSAAMPATSSATRAASGSPAASCTSARSMICLTASSLTGQVGSPTPGSSRAGRRRGRGARAGTLARSGELRS